MQVQIYSVMNSGVSDGCRKQTGCISARTDGCSTAPPFGRQLHCEEELRDPGERPPPLKKATPLSALR